MKITKELLKKHRLGLCNEEEDEAVKEWLAMDENSSTGLELIEGDSAKKDEIWTNLTHDFPELEQKIAIEPAGKFSLSTRMTRYAAAVTALIAFGVLTYSYLTNFAESNASESAYFEDYKTIQTLRGQKRTIHLSDGSTIRLNYETELRAPERFEGDQRVVYLTGHAHFDIARDTERPFIIYTEDSKTQVLGTSFDINTKEEATEIIVTSGQVAFYDKANEDNLVTLSVNDRAMLSADRSIKKDEVNAIALTAWKDNKLLFENQTLKYIIDVLEPWYDVTISVEQPAYLDDTFTLTGENPSLDVFLKELSFAGNFNYRIEGKQVTIY